MKKHNIIIILSIILLIGLSVKYYQTKKELTFYQYLLIPNSLDLLDSYEYALNFERNIVETENESERQELLVTHKHLIENLEGQRNSLRGLLIQEEELITKYETLEIEWDITKAMVDFNKSSSLETQKELIKELEDRLAVFKQFIENIDYQEPEI